MAAQQVAVTAAVILIPIGLMLIGIGTRPRPGGGVPAVPDSTPAAPAVGLAAELTGLAGPADPPEDVEDPAPPLVVLQTRPFTPLVESGHESTPDERRDCRARLGAEVDADLAEVIRLIESRPADLRGLLMNASTAAVAQELAVLRAYLRGALTGLDARLRNGNPLKGDQAVAACLLSGLGRLPVHHGAVFHRAPRGDLALDVFFPGSVLTEPAFTRADRSAFPAGGIGAEPLLNYVIWSEAGRPVPLLVGHSDTVLFTAGSRFRVLALDHQRGDATVYLAEETSHPAARTRREHQVLEHLRGRATAAGVGPIDGPTPSPVPHPGLDETGAPFALQTDSVTA